MTNTIDFSTPFWQDKFVLIDSRKLYLPAQSLFFALPGNFTDGHAFIADLYEKGVRSFVVSRAIDTAAYPLATFVQVPQVLQTLQAYASYHRGQHQARTIGITGSNGKTIVKEWLFQLLERDFRVLKSPKSYNSQLGVPLSVLQLRKNHHLAIFEAGISQPNEMQQLAPIIQPQLGIFTNIGKAHAQGFESIQQKISEKLQLFQEAAIIYPIEQKILHQAIQEQIPNPERHYSWGPDPEAFLPIYWQSHAQHTSVQVHWQGVQQELQIPFISPAAIQNCLHCLVVLLLLDYPLPLIEERIQTLREVPMRLELKAGIHQCQLIDDSYNNDWEGLQIALDFLSQEQHHNYGKTLILSDLPGAAALDQYPSIAQLLLHHGIQRLIAIGPDLKAAQTHFQAIPEQYFFEQTADFLQVLHQEVHFYRERILLKGARAFGFERISQQLQQRSHTSVLEIDLSAIRHNLFCYKSALSEGTRLMVMVKASAYGNGAHELAFLLQYHQVDYLGVAYVDEGIALRQYGIDLPIMVMNPAAHEFELLHQHQLEPVIYSFGILQQFAAFLRQQEQLGAYPIHLELDTGMHRLGFLPEQLPELLSQLQEQQNYLQVQGIFSHLAAADEDQHQAFSLAQIQDFQHLATSIEQTLGIQSIKHLLNSAGISRFQEHQFDMVRLGIGLYGLDPNEQWKQLQPVARFKTIIAQIKSLDASATVGYSRKGTLDKASRIAILSVGYADGYLRAFGNGKAQVKIRDQWAPTLGNICMDMCFVDVSHIPDAQEGDEVLLFDGVESIKALAKAAQTIPYEILTNISARIPRIFYES